jgi:hypothetical protein
VCASAAVERDDATASTDVDQRIAQAKNLLSSTDWDSKALTVDQITEEQKEAAKTRKVPQSTLLGEVQEREFLVALDDAGLLAKGIRVRQHIGCS